MDTYFAKPEKVSDDELENEIRIVSNNPVVSGLLNSMSGLLAIVDENRQIVALNENFLKMLGIDDPGKALGLRPGEALDCVHANNEPAGCGTTPYCQTCGAAIAMVSSLEKNAPVEKQCALTATRDKNSVDIALLVRSQPISINNKRFLLLIVQDITAEQYRAALERTFFHDIKNILNILLQASYLLAKEHNSDMAKFVSNTTRQLCGEVSIQQYLSKNVSGRYPIMWHQYKIEQLNIELKRLFTNHPAANGKHIEFSANIPELDITTDISVLSRVLCNMLINALEATDVNGVVKFWIEHQNEHVAFCVWNQAVIPPEIALRIFQRNFTTKEQPGRGIGTYSMKLFGEGILGGKVEFTSSAEEGTIFRFLHPIFRSDR